MRTEQEIRERYEMFKKEEIPEALKCFDMEEYTILTAMREAVLMEYEFIFGEEPDKVIKKRLEQIAEKWFDGNVPDNVKDLLESI